MLLRMRQASHFFLFYVLELSRCRFARSYYEGIPSNVRDREKKSEISESNGKNGF